jgi:hypothetical protein
VVPRWEPVDGLDLGQDPSGDQWADAIQVGQVRAGGIDQCSDLRADGFHLHVQRADVIQVLAGKLQAHAPTGSTGRSLASSCWARLAVRPRRVPPG